ncbi:zinc finger BED domain-containing protein RICESLEEPER 2-like [Papaver somniferum]|uniref:zinc finger BED domain-containing protein RICESLEEPER 2-like n=1 Tax=Papaver somniferum TaxID=3469 RepID=UPI000E70108C|nr:zinc finger BED domain-containing protein RICESLEEPER 2-like [Papaver somniferum]
MTVAAGFIARIRECVKYVRSSQGRQEKFESALLQMKLPIRYVSIDVDNRWNSTYLMLKSAIELRQGFMRLADLDNSFKCLPNSEEWEQGIVICKCLEVFYDITKKFSGVKYPTTNMYFLSVFQINFNIQTWERSTHSYIREMAKEMRKKFDKYWSTSNLLMSIGMVLDPRYKARLVEFTYKKLYGEMLCRSKMEVFREELDTLFSAYESSSGFVPDYFINSSTSRTQSSNHENTQAPSKYEIQLEFKEYMMQDCVVDIHKSELQKYLDEPLLEEASESTFSDGGRVLTTHRSSLAPEAVQALLCLNDWLPDLIDDDNEQA